MEPFEYESELIRNDDDSYTLRFSWTEKGKRIHFELFMTLGGLIKLGEDIQAALSER